MPDNENAPAISHRDRIFVSLAEAAARYGVSERTIQRRVWDGSLKARKVGRSVRVPLDDLDALFEAEAR